jgi:hypothetical protein
MALIEVIFLGILVFGGLTGWLTAPPAPPTPAEQPAVVEQCVYCDSA